MPLSLRFALRELRGGVRGFRIFLACLALEVAAIAAAGSTAQAFRQGIASQSREILGGDLAVTVDQHRFSPRERAVMARAGQVAYATAARAMATSPTGDRRLVEIRGVTDNFPLAGVVKLKGGGTLAQAFRTEGGVPGAVVEQALLDRLHLPCRRRIPGQRHQIGRQGRARHRTGSAIARLRAGPPRPDLDDGDGEGRLPDHPACRSSRPLASLRQPTRRPSRSIRPTPSRRRWEAAVFVCVTATTPPPA